MSDVDTSRPAATMRELLARYVPVIREWNDPDGGLPDPYETIYTENYAPANAAAVLASVCRSQRTEEAAELLRIMVARTVELLADKDGVNPFCRVFLYHYGLMAILFAPDKDRADLVDRFGPALAAYEDDCAVVNTNCAALQWAMELFTEAAGLREADGELLAHRLRFIAAAQLDSGFINDEISEKESQDGMPIAYHAFTLFLLMSAFAAIESWPERHAATRREAERIVGRGMSWLRRAVTPDGSFAMVERSSYQTFTWGAITALLAYADPAGGFGATADAALRQWLPYAHEDGTYGCTPNVLPHSLRVGYETYTHLNMYNLLGLTGIAMAERVLDRGLRLPEPETSESGPSGAEAGAASPTGRDSPLFVDPASGYAFFRGGGNGAFFGCTLRVHNRQYAPAMQGFHFRIDGRPLPIAEPRLPGMHEPPERIVREGVWEGYWIADETGQPLFPSHSDNARTEPVDGGIAMLYENDRLRCEKTMTATAEGVVWSFSLLTKRPIRSCAHVVPLLVHDGRNALRFVERGENKLKFSYAGKFYVLECSGAASIELELQRSLLSVSGLSAKVRADVSGPVEAGAVIRWSTSLRPV